MKATNRAQSFVVPSEPIEQREHPGYYPSYSTLGRQDYWDEATLKAVTARPANYLIKQGDGIFFSNGRDQHEPGFATISRRRSRTFAVIRGLRDECSLPPQCWSSIS